MNAVTVTPRWATERQVKFIKRLLTENELYSGDYDRLWKMLEAHEIDVITPGDGTRIPRSQATAILDWLISEVKKLNGSAIESVNGTAVTKVCATPGVYAKDGVIYVVVPSRKNPDRVYAKKLVESPPRLTESGRVLDFELEYVPGVVWDLTEGDRMTLLEARDLIVKYGKCLKCKKALKQAKTLKTAEETGLMVGPVCRKYFA